MRAIHSTYCPHIVPLEGNPTLAQTIPAVFFCYDNNGILGEFLYGFVLFYNIPLFCRTKYKQTI